MSSNKTAPSPNSKKYASILEEALAFIIKEKEADRSIFWSLRDSLMDDFVDWNEVRIASPDRLEKAFAKLKNGESKRKVIQALLNKIFSRSGSLDHQFMLDFSSEALEDYLAGVMEMNEKTRAALIEKVLAPHLKK
ncbi:MAG: hypothetical protein HQL31_00635 [Planctomycetes bacterium]|nr:hypothetical protein [Planctomycetota bacterium]